MSAEPCDHSSPSPDQDTLRRQYEATRAAGIRHRSDSAFMERVGKAITHLDGKRSSQTMTQAEFLERYPSKP